METETDIDDAGTSTPIACTLTNKEAAQQVLEWGDLQHRAAGVSPLDDGVRMTFPAAMFDEVEDLARRESACCAFLTITTSVVDDVLTLDISSDNPDAMPVIHALAGMPRP